MEIGKLIKILAVTEDIPLTELAEKVGISRQAMYKRLESGMKFESAREILKALGYDLYYGKDGSVKKI